MKTFLSSACAIASLFLIEWALDLRPLKALALQGAMVLYAAAFGIAFFASKGARRG